jgi:hypothetical protein
MKKITVLLFVLMLGKAYSQTANWSAEVNYPFVVGEEAFNDVEGVLDVGLKYRFVDLRIAKL